MSFIMSALAIHLYLEYYYINLIFNNFGIFYRTIVGHKLNNNFQFARNKY